MAFTKEGISSNTVDPGPKVGKAARDIHHGALETGGERAQHQP